MRGGGSWFPAAAPRAALSRRAPPPPPWTPGRTWAASTHRGADLRGRARGRRGRVCPPLHRDRDVAFGRLGHHRADPAQGRLHVLGVGLERGRGDVARHPDQVLVVHLVHREAHEALPRAEPRHHLADELLGLREGPGLEVDVRDRLRRRRRGRGKAGRSAGNALQPGAAAGRRGHAPAPSPRGRGAPGGPPGPVPTGSRPWCRPGRENPAGGDTRLAGLVQDCAGHFNTLCTSGTTSGCRRLPQGRGAPRRGWIAPVVAGGGSRCPPGAPIAALGLFLGLPALEEALVRGA